MDILFLWYVLMVIFFDVKNVSYRVGKICFEEEKNAIDDFEFNQDIEENDEDTVRSPGWLRYQKRIK